MLGRLIIPHMTYGTDAEPTIMSSFL